MWSSITFSLTGHALTIYGDDADEDAVHPEPNVAYLTDSDQDLAGYDRNDYVWLTQKDPASGHTYYYLEDYFGTGQHGYLGYVVTLCRVPEPGTVTLLTSLAFTGAVSLTFARFRRRVRSSRV